MLNRYLDLNFNVVHAATYNRDADDNYKKLVKLGPIVLFSCHKLTTFLGKHLENISHAHFVSLMYKLLTSGKDTNNLSFGFDRDRNRGQRELSNNKKMKGKNHVRVMLGDMFEFAEFQGKATDGFRYNLTLTRNSDNSVLNKANATNDAKIKFFSNEWFVPHYTPSIPQQVL